MANWLTTREAIKRAARISGTDRDPQIDALIEGASREVDRRTRRRFIPITEARFFDWPQPSHLSPGDSDKLWLDEDLLSVTTLKTKAQDSSPTTISSSDYFTEPENYGPPYNRIEVDKSSSAAFEAGDTPQRSIEVTGSWGYGNATVVAGALDEGSQFSSSDTTLVVSDGSVIDVGDTILLTAVEQVFVSEKTSAALGSILIDDASVTKDKADVTITVDGSHGLKAGEVILVDSEQMLITAISTNDLTVIRAYNGSVLAAHSDNTAVHVFRTLTVTRGVNGTDATAHADGGAITKYQPPLDIQALVRQLVLDGLVSEAAMKPKALSDYVDRIVGLYRRPRMAAV